MANKLYEESNIQAIANAIRSKGITGSMTVAQMPEKIGSISGGGKSGILYAYSYWYDLAHIREKLNSVVHLPIDTSITTQVDDGDLLVLRGGYTSDLPSLNNITYIGTLTRFDQDTVFRITLPYDGATCSFEHTCFVADTKVSMSDGSYKNIIDVHVGDKVLGYKNAEYVESIVLKKFVHKHFGKIYKIFYDDNYLETTGNHPIYCEGQYKRADELKINDNLFVNGHNSSIVDIEVYDVENVDVYNLDVDNTDNYIVNNCLAHNKPA